MSSGLSQFEVTVKKAAIQYMNHTKYEGLRYSGRKTKFVKILGKFLSSIYRVSKILGVHIISKYFLITFKKLNIAEIGLGLLYNF